MTGSKRILIIDDDDDFVRAVRALLEGDGYEVQRESHGEAGLLRARSLRPDLILLDVMMRERTEGFFVLQEIRRSPGLRDVPVIVLSSIYADQPFFRVSPEAGWLPADAFLPKPVDPAKLLRTAADLLSADRAAGRVPEDAGVRR